MMRDKALCLALIGFLATATAVNAADPPKPADKADRQERALVERLDALAIQGAVLPAEEMRSAGQSVLAVYRLFEAKDGDIEIVYGFATTDNRSIYRSYALAAKQIRFELVRRADDKAPLMAEIRGYVATAARESFTVRSLMAELPLGGDRRVTSHLAGPCGGPYGSWLEIIDAGDKIVANRLVARRFDPPQSFSIPAHCPLAVGTNGLPVRATSQGRTVHFAQAVPLGDGGFLAAATTDPLLVRFDATLKAPMLDRVEGYAAIEFGDQQHKEVIEQATRDAAVPGQSNAAVTYDRLMWAAIDNRPRATAPQPPDTAKPLPKPSTKPVVKP